MLAPPEAEEDPPRPPTSPAAVLAAASIFVNLRAAPPPRASRSPVTRPPLPPLDVDDSDVETVTEATPAPAVAAAETAAPDASRAGPGGRENDPPAVDADGGRTVLLRTRSGALITISTTRPVPRRVTDVRALVGRLFRPREENTDHKTEPTTAVAAAAEAAAAPRPVPAWRAGPPSGPRRDVDQDIATAAADA